MFTDAIEFQHYITRVERDYDDAIARLAVLSRCEDLADQFDDCHPAALADFQPSVTDFDYYWELRHISDVTDTLWDIESWCIYADAELDELQAELDAVPEWEYFWMPSAT